MRSKVFLKSNNHLYKTGLFQHIKKPLYESTEALSLNRANSGYAKKGVTIAVICSFVNGSSKASEAAAAEIC